MVCCPFFRMPLPNCTIGNNFYPDTFEDWASRWHCWNRLKQGLSRWGGRFCVSGQLPTFMTPGRPEPSGGTLRPWSRAPSSQRVPIIDFSLGKKKKKSQMPLARGAGTSLALSRKHWCFFWLRIGRHFVRRLGAPPVLSPHLLWNCGWKSLHQRSSQSLSLLPGVDAIHLNA